MFQSRLRTLALISSVLLCAAVYVTLAARPTSASSNYDVVILNGTVMDPESGLNALRNVGIRNGKIAVITQDRISGQKTIDAKGLVVAPGFIDLHQHGQSERNYEFQAHDGVTTSLELEVGTDDVAGWYAQREGKSLINYGVSSGHI